jgi:hypothetical protein
MLGRAFVVLAVADTDRLPVGVPVEQRIVCVAVKIGFTEPQTYRDTTLSVGRTAAHADEAGCSFRQLSAKDWFEWIIGIWDSHRCVFLGVLEGRVS